MFGSPPETGNSQSMSNPSATPFAMKASRHEATNAVRLASVDETSEKSAAPQPPIERMTFRFGRACRCANTALTPAVLAVVQAPLLIVENAQKKWVTRSIWMLLKFGVPDSR